MNHSQARLWDLFTDRFPQAGGGPVVPNSVFLTGAQKIATVMRDGRFFEVYRDYARRFSLLPDGTFKPEEEVNLPGRLLRTWATAGGERLYLTMESRSHSFPDGPTDRRDWLLLLRATTLGGHPVAELRRCMAFLTSTYRAGDGRRPPVRQPRSQLAPALRGSARGDPIGIAWPSSTCPRFHSPAVSTGPPGCRSASPAPIGAGWRCGPRAAWSSSDARDPARPIGQTFLRAHDEATHFELTGDNLHVAAGHFGLRQARLDAPPIYPRCSPGLLVSGNWWVPTSGAACGP